MLSITGKKFIQRDILTVESWAYQGFSERSSGGASGGTVLRPGRWGGTVGSASAGGTGATPHCGSRAAVARSRVQHASCSVLISQMMIHRIIRTIAFCAKYNNFDIRGASSETAICKGSRK